jgi:hypothetical protein
VSGLGGDSGFWPGPEVAKRYVPGEAKAPKAPPVPREPVVLKPYQPRSPIPFTPFTDEELAANAGDILIFDTECFSNFFLAAFKHLLSSHVLTFTHPLDADKLSWLLQSYTLVGFNSLKYDLPLLAYALTGATTQNLKLLSNDLIKGLYFKQAAQKYSFTIPHLKHIDLIEVCPGHGSLKLYGGRLHAKRIQDVPWAAEQSLEDWQIPITTDYCINDLDNTEFVYNGLQEQLALRTSLSKEYKQDLMSKSDAQIAEAVIGSELKRIKGRYPGRPKVQVGKVHYFVPPENLKFQTEYMHSVLTTVEKAEFKIGADGYLERPKEIEDLRIEIGGSVYRMGIGGLHSSEETTSLIADDTFELWDADVASYYPAIILNCKLTPKHLGADFLTIYKGLVDSRLEDKKAKRLAQSESKKVLVNGTFGKTGSPHSIFYAPEVIIQILLGGQLYLLMLIENLEAMGASVVSANTDGVLIKCPVALRRKMQVTIKAWEAATGFVTEATQYRSYHARDVNAYLAIAMDGKVKAKNIYYDPWRGVSAKDAYWRFQKNPTCQICVEAVELFLTKGIPLEETILECNDVTRFVAIKNVTGGAHYEGDYLGKVVRWVYVKGRTQTINYITSNRIVADTEGAWPLMDLPLELPEDIDYERYIKRAKEMLENMGWKADAPNI